MKPNIQWLEWEDFTRIKCTILQNGNISEHFSHIEIWRDENYRILFELSGKLPEGLRTEDFMNEKQMKAGETFDPVTEIIVKPEKNNPYSRIIIDQILVRNYLREGITNIFATGEIFKLKFYYDFAEAGKEPEAIEFGYANETKSDSKSEEETAADTYVPAVEYINYWFINGFENMEYLVTRKIEYDTKLKIDYSDEFKTDINAYSGSDLSRYYQILLLKGKPFVFGFIKSDITGGFPGTFLRFKKDNMPNDYDLEILQFSLSFIMGLELIPIGNTMYDINNSPIEKNLISSFRDDIKRVCNIIPIPPVAVDTIRLMDLRLTDRIQINIINEMNFFISKFFEFYNSFHLKQIVSYIISSRQQSLDIQIQPLATALEVFQKAWFISEFSISKGKYLKDEEYDPLIDKFIPDIEKELNQIPNYEIIIKKIRSSNDIGFTQKFPIMFTEMNLPIAEVEEKALLERNIVIHGTLKTKDYQRLGSITNAFITLVYRTILKLFEYPNYYIDYSTYGFPLRKVSEPLGGPNNDKKI